MKLGGVDLKRTVKSYSVPFGEEYASLAIIEGVPRRQHVGTEAQDITLQCHFHQAIIDVAGTLTQLVDLKSQAAVVDLQLDTGLIWGSYLVMRVTFTPTSKLPDETIIAADVQINLGDPGNVADVDTPPAVAVTGVAGAQSGAPLENTSTSPSDATAQQIARRG